MNMAKNKKTVTNNSKLHNLTKGEAGRIVTFRVLIIVLFDIIIGSLFDYIIHADGNIELFFYTKVRPALMVVSIVLFALAAAYLVLARVKKLDSSRHPMTPLMIVFATLFLMLTVVLYNTFRLTPILFFTVMIVGSILIAVYYVYTMLLY